MFHIDCYMFKPPLPPLVFLGQKNRDFIVSAAPSKTKAKGVGTRLFTL